MKKSKQPAENKHDQQKLVAAGQPSQKEKESQDKLRVKKSKQPAKNKPDQQKLGAAGKNPRKEKELNDKFGGEKLRESITSEHYRQMLVRDGQSRFDDWHESYHGSIKKSRG